MGSSGDNAETRRKKLEIESNEKIANDNLDYQRENLDYQRALQERLFQREDTNIQRQVSDARAAGVSPLAIGLQGGSAGSAIETQALNNSNRVDMMSGMSTDAQRAEMLINAISSVSNTISQVQGITRQKLENEYLQRTLDSRVNYQYGTEILQSYERADARTKAYYNQVYGIHSGMSETEKKIRLLKGALGLNTGIRDFNGNVYPSHDVKDNTHSQGSYSAFDKEFGSYTAHDYGNVPNYAEDNLEDMLDKVVGKGKSYLDKLLNGYDKSDKKSKSKSYLDYMLDYALR